MNIDGTTLKTFFWFLRLSAGPHKLEHKVDHIYITVLFIINLEKYQIDHSSTGCCYIRNTGKGFKFGNNATDTFRGKEKLGECFNAFMTLTCSVEFKYFQIERSQSWNGEYLEIGFDNQARIHCDFKEYEFSIGNPKDPSLQGISLLRG